jgi:elongation factor Tu
MPTDSTFQLTVEDVFTIRGRGTVVTGRIASGTVKEGDEVLLTRPGVSRKTTVTAIESFRKKLKEATAGDNVGLLLRDITKDDIQRGDVLSARDPDFTWKP